jgi:hypothetical protein
VGDTRVSGGWRVRVWRAATYEDPDLLVFGKVADGLVLLAVRHAPEVVEEIDVFVLQHPPNDASNEDEVREN